ncbi:MAG: type II toxin-antitoxin system VapC family toxin [Acidimicrobiia bacterium]|nr:type II toxin-antitoxin system VapC family toxin [Acidimicrobiia bacterium]
MITYVDTSTLLKRLLAEDGSDAADAIWNAADVLACAATAVVEARAALAAAQRGGRLTAGELRAATSELGDLLEEVTFVAVTDTLIAEAADLAESEALRGYDAVHLAAALSIEANVVTSSDAALCAAAERRGLHVANPLDV